MTDGALFRDGREAKMAGKDVIVSSTDALQVYQILPAGSTDAISARHPWPFQSTCD